MNVTLLSDRERISPQTGEVIPRDRPATPESQALAARFAQERVLRVLRGGVASFQVIVSTDAPSDGVEIPLRIDRFTGPGWPPERIDVYYEWPLHIGDNEWTYEALIPTRIYRQAPAEVRQRPLGPRRHHAFWIDVPIRRDTQPGPYTSEIRVGEQRVRITIHVLPITLPLTPRITIDLNSYSEALHTQHHPGLTGPDQVACERSYYREAHDNRTVLHYLPYDHAGLVTRGYAPPLAGRGKHLHVADWSEYDARFGPLFDGSAFAGSPGGERPLPHWYLPFNYDWPADFAYAGTRGYDEEFARVLAEFRRHFQEKGWTETNFEVFFNHKKRYRFFPWDGDERKHTSDRAHFLHYRALIDRARQLAGPGGEKTRIVYRTDISWSFAQDAIDDQIGPLFDLWVIGASNFAWTGYGVRALHERGQLAWWYGGVGGPDRRTMDVDRQAILCWRRGADGFLASWLNMARDPMLDKANELSMLYPGRRFGWDRALGSIRLRAARRATETADLLELLGDDGRELVDAMAGVKGDEAWFLSTPAWSFWPTEVMDNDMYSRQRFHNPLETADPHLPALIRERALDLILERR